MSINLKKNGVIMKRIIFAAALVSVLMLIIPLSALSDEGDRESTVKVIRQATENSVAESLGDDTFRVSDKQSGEVKIMTRDEYIFGVVAAEMPVSYNTEALKAQAVAAYTYASYKREANKKKEYDITTDYRVDQSYKSEEELRKQWGGNFNEYANKIRDAVQSVKGITITSNGKPILAVYHAVSPGKTVSAKDVWGEDIPYLKAVLSTGDKLAPNYISKKTVTQSDVKSEFKSEKGDIESIESDASGFLKTAKIGNKKYSAGEIRSAFSLQSAFFKVEKEKSDYAFEIYGHGHGVGMSQNGANYMAKQGYNYKEILNHYYTGCKLTAEK